ncbi:MAG TPA: AI-2E family transporter [Anaerolineales bacterium]|nr:AI-2E family transporter [Anaerolineales bacterium]
MNRNWDAPFRYIVLTALLILLAGLLWYIRDVFKPLLSAALIAYFLSPSVNFVMTRFHLQRRTAANVVYVSTLTVVVILSVTLVPVMFEEMQSILADVKVAFSDLETLLSQPFDFGGLHLDLRLLASALRTLIDQNSIVPQPADALRFLQVTSRGFLWTLVILVTIYYLMTEWGQLRGWLIKLAPSHEQNDLTQLYYQIRAVWMGYLRGQIRLMVILALMYSIAWQIIGLQGALPLGIFAGLLNLLPEVGPAAIALLATVVALLEGSTIFTQLPHVWFAALTLGVFLLLNTLKTVFIQPRILGQSVLIHEALVFIAIVVALILQGVLGVLIVVPLLASVIIVGKYIRRRLLGLPPFEEDDESILSPDSPSKSKTALKRTPARKKTPK